LGKGLAGESTTQVPTKVAAGGLPVTVGYQRAIELGFEFEKAFQVFTQNLGELF
jgi:hypothetical protein